jgi:hypothetical protein
MSKRATVETRSGSSGVGEAGPTSPERSRSKDLRSARHRGYRHRRAGTQRLPVSPQLLRWSVHYGLAPAANRDRTRRRQADRDAIEKAVHGSRLVFLTCVARRGTAAVPRRSLQKSLVPQVVWSLPLRDALQLNWQRRRTSRRQPWGNLRAVCDAYHAAQRPPLQRTAIATRSWTCWSGRPWVRRGISRSRPSSSERALSSKFRIVRKTLSPMRGGRQCLPSRAKVTMCRGRMRDLGICPNALRSVPINVPTIAS